MSTGGFIVSDYINKYNEVKQGKKSGKSIAEVVDDFMRDVDPDIFKPKITFLDISSVIDDNVVDTKPILQFRDWDGVEENICNVIDLDDGLNKVRQILKDSSYESHYMRTYKPNNVWVIDYGSHNTSFLVKEAK